MKNKVFILYLILVTSILGNGCTNNHGNGIINPVQCEVDTLKTVSFTTNLQPIFKQYCTVSSCHSGVNPSGNLNLDSAVAYQELIKAGTGNIDIENPSSSLLYSQLISTITPMPPTGKLDDCTIKLILKWIQQGAINN